MESVITSKGITLMGEAANAYVTYKYFDSCLTFAILVIVGYCIYKGVKYMADHL